MKLGMDIFCSSPASTAIRCGRSDRHRLPSQTQKHRHVHESSSSSITPRLIRVLSTPCSSSSDLALNTPKPVDYLQLRKQPSGRKSVSSSCYGAGDRGVVSGSDEQVRRRRSSADVSELKLMIRASPKAGSSSDRSGKCIIVTDDNGPLFDQRSTSKSAALVPAGATTTGNSYDDDPHDVKLERKRRGRTSSRCPPLTMASSRSSVDENDSPKLKCPSSLSSSSSSSRSTYDCSTADKVVVLWVSLHCKGCEAKVRKHISKMEGVKSYNTDLATKKVTIISNMHPNDVLASVSRVKYAQLWPPSSSSSSSSSSSLIYDCSSSWPSAALLPR